MITQNTLFILGAGASHPYNYPSGKELRKRICFEFVDNYRNLILKNTSNENIDAYLQVLTNFTTKFYKSSNKSIDLFLARNPKLLDLGKYAIALEILKAENESNFREEIKRPEYDWYSYIFDRLTNTFLDEKNYAISDNKVSFITFNYDRSFEQFLFESLLNSFEDLKGPKAAEEINKIHIIHIYGKVSPLPWEADGLTIKYKSELSDLNTGIAVGNIQVMNEALEDNVTVKTRELIQNAKKIFFLGFGYAKENIELLNFPKILHESQFIYGTGLGLTNREINVISAKYFLPGVNYPSHIKFDNKFDNLMLLKRYL